MSEALVRPQHDRREFFKYRSAAHLIDSLERREIRLTAPSLFNDPFDLTLDLRLGSSIEEVLTRGQEQLHRIVLADEDPPGDPKSGIYQEVMRLRQVRKKLQRPPESISGELVRELAAGAERGFAESKAQFQRWLSNLRVVCLVERPDNLLMWGHYADGHRGGVLAIRCDPALDSILWTAAPVKYQRELPVLVRAEYFLRRLLGPVPEEEGEIYWDMHLTKSVDWEYEQEWRAMASAAPGEGPVRTSALAPQEIGAVYLGLNMAGEARARVLGLCTGDLAHVEVHQARKSPDQFALDFERVR